MRRVAKRAEKSATPQPKAAISPRIISLGSRDILVDREVPSSLLCGPPLFLRERLFQGSKSGPQTVRTGGQRAPQSGLDAKHNIDSHLYERPMLKAARGIPRSNS